MPRNPLLDPPPTFRTRLRKRLSAVLRWIFTSWHAPAIVGVLLLIGLAVWVRPVRIERVVKDAATGNTRVVTAWDTSRWQAVSAFWWQASLVALAGVAVLTFRWWGGTWLVAKAAAARFFAASLLVHCLLVMSLGGVPLARAVAEHAEIIQAEQAAQLFDEEPKAGRVAERPAFEKVADPQAEKVDTPHLVRQPVVPAAAPDSDPLVPTIPMQAVRTLPPARVVFVPARQPEVVRQPVEIQRAFTRALKPVELDLEKPALPPPEPLPREKPIEARPVILARQGLALPVVGETDPLRLPDLKRPPIPLRPEMKDQPRIPEERLPPAALPGRRQPGRIVLAAPNEAKPDLKAETTQADKLPGDNRVALPRLVPPPLVPARTPDERPVERLPVGQPVRADIPRVKVPEVTPSLGPVTDRLPRAIARADRTAGIDEKVVPVPVPLVVARQKEERKRSVAMYGGTKASEEAVERGLDYLAAHQNANGSWSLHNFHVNCKHAKCTEPGTVVSDPAATGIVLLPFLGAGNTDQAGKHKLTVARALHWLLTQQQADGTWSAPQDARPMYGHAIASIALCEAYGMTQNAKLRAPAQKALDYIVRAQHAASGGWRYKPNQPADTSVVGWQMMALKSGEMAGLSVPAKTFEGIKRWLASVEANKPVGGQFGYMSATPTPAMTAQGLLCLQYLGAKRDEPRMRAGTDYLLKNLPRASAETSYYWYNATQVMYHMQGNHWKAWNDKLRDLLVSTQEMKGPAAGSWKPTDHREKPGGRLYATALRLLMLEVYYRHLPLYQQLEK
jgi:hypothetical protein